MFGAVVAAMRDAPREVPRDEWLTTIAELFAIVHRGIAMDEERMQPGKKRYPKLKGDEKALLYNLFREVCVINPGTYAQWEQKMEVVIRDLHNTRGTFKYIIQRDIGKQKWATVKPLNQWAAKAKAGTPVS
jgi:hypothetical protein